MVHNEPNRLSKLHHTSNRCPELRKSPIILLMLINRYYTLPTYFRQQFGCRIQKIPLDAGSTCPNRDGTIGTSGCIFCNQQGSGTGLALSGLDIAQQYQHLRARYLERKKNIRFLAYFQSFSNTYGPAHRLQQLLTTLSGLPDLAGISIGTRPDCLDQEKIDIISHAQFQEIWLDLGLQSAHEKTLQLIKRGHDAQTFAVWTKNAASQGIKICAHLITGLPGESLAEFEQTIAFVNSLPVAGVKIHNLYVSRGSNLTKLWEEGGITLLSREESLRWLCRGLELLRPDIVVHRLNADPAPDELLAPGWATDKRSFLHDAKLMLERKDTWQGKAIGHPLAQWYTQEKIL